MRGGVEIIFAGPAAIAFAAFFSPHRHYFLTEWLPRPLTDWIPILYIVGFTIAVFLLGVKHPTLILDGVFARGDLPVGQEAGVFVTNVGEKAATQVTIDSLGDGSYSMGFEV